MKKLHLCIFLVLMFCNTGFAEENAEMIGYKEKKLDYNFECLSLDKKIKKLFGFKIYSNPNKISGLDGKDEILFKVPYFNKSYGLPTSLVIAVDINGKEFNKMFVTYGIEYKSLDKPAYIVEEFTYLKDNKPGLYIEIYYQLEPIIVEFAHTTYGMFDKQYLDGTDSVDVYINSIIVKTNNLSKPISAKKYIKIAKEINYICKNK